MAGARSQDTGMFKTRPSDLMQMFKVIPSEYEMVNIFPERNHLFFLLHSGNSYVFTHCHHENTIIISYNNVLYN